MRETSFKRRLLALIMLAVGGGQALMTVFVLWGEAERYAINKKDLLLAQAHVVAAAVSGAAARGDVKTVYEGLRAAARLPNIRFVSVSDLEGNRIAELGAAELLASDLVVDQKSPLSAWRLLRARSFALRAPIVQGGTPVGTVVLIGDAGDLKASLRSGFMTSVGAAAAALGLALAITLHMQRIITRPLTGLVGAMQRVAASHDYALSAPHSEISELRILIEGFNGMLAEIRERDRQIARSYAELEGQVQDRTRDLRAAKEAAEASRVIADEANAQKSSFLATMSHEIRTPMNGMLVMAELLARSQLPAAAQRYADVIWRSGRSLLAIINDILDFSKIEAGRLEIERAPLDVAETVGTVLDLFGERARAKGLDLAARIDVNAPRSIVGDVVRLTQIISNLVSNALKFTERGGVLVTVEPGPEPDSIRFAVQDTGVGIAADKLQTIFAAFSQADMSTTRRYGGTGLGLAISQRLANAMAAEIQVASEPGSGSVFSFMLLDCAEARAPWPMRGFENPLNEIIICERGPFTRGTLAYYAQSAGVSTILAEPYELAEHFRYGRVLIAEWSEELAPALAQARRHGVRLIAVRKSETAMSSLADPEAFLSWPLARRDVEGLLRALFSGDHLQATTEGDAKRPFRKLSGLKVLVAEDNEVNREVAKEALEQLGATVTLVSDGLQAVTAHASTSFDLLMLDGSMPTLSGFDAARHIRQRELETGGTRVPIIAFTAHVLGDGAAEWRVAGMDLLVSKPFTLEQLATGVETALGRDGVSFTPAPVAAETIETALDLIDRKVFGELAGLSLQRKGFLERVVRLYSIHAPEAVDAIRRYAMDEQLDGIAKSAHALKSMSLNIGASAVARVGAQLEFDAKNGGMADPVLLKRLARLIEATCKELEQTLDETTLPFVVAS